MGRSRSDIEQTAKQLAAGFVAMENGLWNWGDGKQHLDENGRPQIVKRKLLDAVGMTSEKGYRYFQYPPDPDNYAATVFWREVAIERNRVAMGLKEAIARLQPDFLEMGQAFLKELWCRFKVAPESFTNAELAKYGPSFVKVGLAIEAMEGQRDDRQTKHAVHAMLEEMRSRLGESPELFQQLVEITSRRLIATAGEIVDVSTDRDSTDVSPVSSPAGSSSCCRRPTAREI